MCKPFQIMSYIIHNNKWQKCLKRSKVEKLKVLWSPFTPVLASPACDCIAKIYLKSSCIETWRGQIWTSCLSIPLDLYLASSAWNWIGTVKTHLNTRCKHCNFDISNICASKPRTRTATIYKDNLKLIFDVRNTFFVSYLSLNRFL